MGFSFYHYKIHLILLKINFFEKKFQFWVDKYIFLWYNIFCYGEMSEWFKELVLKTSDAKAPRVRISISPPYRGQQRHTAAADTLFGEVLKLAEEAPLLRV